MRRILDFFPKGQEKIRLIQKEILEEISNELDKGTKFIIIEAPTGVGKSDVNVTAALYQKGGTILTTQKILQDQYEESFKFVRKVKGKNHFPCHQKKDKENCDKGICRFPNGKYCKHYVFLEQMGIKNIGTIEEEVYLEKESTKEECGYYLQSRLGEQASFAVYNYAKYLTSYFEEEIDDEDHRLRKLNSNQKELLICDEGHNLENALAEFGTLELSTEHAEKCENYEVIDEILAIERFWEDVQEKHNKRKISDLEYESETESLVEKTGKVFTILKNSYSNKIEEIRKEIAEKLEHKEIRTGQTTIEQFTFENDFDEFSPEEKKLAELQQKLDDLEQTLNEWKEFEINDNFVFGDVKGKIEFNDPKSDLPFTTGIRRGAKTVSLKPIYVQKIAEKLFSQFKHVIFTSSTIHEKFFKLELGISDDEAYYKSFQSPFKIENRLIFRDAKMDLNYSNWKTEIKKAKSEINRLLDLHKSEKGIIHVTSYAYQKEVIELLSDENKQRIKEIGKGTEREKDIEEHKNSKENSVIISPACWEGIDLADDNSRFQIIIKAPYLSLGDLRIKKKKNNPKFGYNWYSAYSLQKLIQGCGRSIRNENDFAKTYLLDMKCYSLIENPDAPKWFRDSVK